MVTGATGFIGRHLVQKLRDEGEEVHVLGRARDSREILTVMQTAKPEIVFHLASLFLVEHTLENVAALCDSNIRFGTEVVEAMNQCGCRRLVHAGTAWQNSSGRKGTAVNLYAATKEAFEAILRYYVDAHQLHVINLKLNDTYGPGDTRRKLVSILRDAAHTKKPLGLSPGEQKLDLLHVSDVVNGFRVAGQRLVQMDKPQLEEFYLRSERLINIHELVEIFKTIGAPIEAQWGQRPYRNREVMIPWQEGSVLPNWKPTVALETGLRQFLLEKRNV